jgi:coenzyme F420 hydrogenase subunit delta
MMDWYNEIMVVGCGNPLQTDDGFGPAVVAELKKLELPKNVQVLDAGLGGPHFLFTLMANSDAPIRKMIIIDILDFGAEPGQVTRITPDLLPSGMYVHEHAHECGLLDPLQVLKDRIDIVIFGCQPECLDISQITNETEDIDFWVTDSVRKAIPKTVRLVLDEIGVDYGTTIISQGAHHREETGKTGISGKTGRKAGSQA